jgi:hypothetical protein
MHRQHTHQRVKCVFTRRRSRTGIRIKPIKACLPKIQSTRLLATLHDRPGQQTRVNLHQQRQPGRVKRPHRPACRAQPRQHRHTPQCSRAYRPSPANLERRKRQPIPLRCSQLTRPIPAQLRRTMASRPAPRQNLPRDTRQPTSHPATTSTSQLADRPASLPASTADRQFASSPTSHPTSHPTSTPPKRLSPEIRVRLPQPPLPLHRNPLPQLRSRPTPQFLQKPSRIRE